jgi:hypothetical protein
LDVNNNGTVSSNDAATVISELLVNGSHVLPATKPEGTPPYFVDVNGNGSLTPADAVIVISFLLTASAGPLAAPAHVFATNAGGGGGRASEDNVPEDSGRTPEDKVPGDSGVASALTVTLDSPPSDSEPRWLGLRLSEVDLNSSRVAAVFQHLADKDTPTAGKLVATADQIANSIGLNYELLDSFLADLGLE